MSEKKVAIVMGSDSDLPVVKAAAQVLWEFGIGTQVRVVPPVYVELTREDLELPVVRAIVPGLELTADFDAHSRPSVRLFRRYLKKAGSFERE